MSLSPELAALRDEAMHVSCEAWAIQHRWVLSRGIDRAGPCPNCGGTDRFSIHTKDNIFNCRKCALKGSGVIDLVMQTQQVGFVEACEIVTGRKADEPVSEARMAALRRQTEADARRRAAEANAYRERARAEAAKLWSTTRALGVLVPDVLAYLALRAVDLRTAGLELAAFGALHELGDMAWTEEFEDPDSGARGWRVLHVGPAMVARIMLPQRLVTPGDPLGRFGGVHITWIDPRIKSGGGADKGKLSLPADDNGKPRPTKKVRGSKKGGAIPLYTPASPKRLVMGEGIETTLTPLVHAFEPDTAYWAGIDVGNIGGKALRVDGRMIHDQPDLEDLDCFIPPDWCEEFVLLGESDEASVHSRDKCIRGLRRAQLLREAARKSRPELPALTTIYVPPPEGGKDLNDLAMAEQQAGAGDEGNTAAADGPQAVGRADAFAAERTERGED